MVVEVNRTGIERTHQAMGGEGTILLQFSAEGPVDGATLDNAIPDEVEGLENGGWFEGPRGWLLLIEGMPEQVDPWLDRLASGLDAVGVTGTLTGASQATDPAWSGPLLNSPELNASLAFVVPDSVGFYGDWGGIEPSRDVANEVALQWLTGQDGRIMVHPELSAQFWFSREQARAHITGTEIGRDSVYVTSFSQPHHTVRAARISTIGRMRLTGHTDPGRWRILVDDLRAALLATPRETLAMACISHRGWAGLTARLPGDDDLAKRAYTWHPELASRFLLDASGIQIVTDQHLDKANDLSTWTITDLGDGHHLLEAEDLEPWYAHAIIDGRRYVPEVLDQARHDFGDMILTAAYAEARGLHHKPPLPQRP